MDNALTLKLQVHFKSGCKLCSSSSSSSSMRHIFPKAIILTYKLAAVSKSMQKVQIFNLFTLVYYQGHLFDKTPEQNLLSHLNDMSEIRMNNICA